MKRVLSLFLSLSLYLIHGQAQNRILISQYENELAASKDDKEKVDLMNKLAAEYLNAGDEMDDEFWEKPMKYAKDAVSLASKIDYKKGLGDGYQNMSNIYRKKNNYMQANIYALKAQKAKSQVTDESEKTAKEEEQKRIQKEEELKKQQEENERQLAANKKQMEATRKQQLENERLAREGKISKEEAEKRAREIQAKQEQLTNANQKIQEQVETIKTKDEVIVQTQLDKDSLAMLSKIQEQDLKLKDAENENHKKQRIIFILFAVAGAVLAVLMALFFLFQRRTAMQLAYKNRIIEDEKRRSEELLLNILPMELANELKAHGSAQARNYEQVTVLFTDFKDFTKISERLSPKHLVDEIDYCFRAFDDIVGKYNIEKIKTIGDAYLCAGGIPIANTHDPLKVVRAALEIQQFMEKIKIERQGGEKPYFEIRIGIHTGPLVAGVVGSKKFAYDIWGDTVNTAARMEQNSEPGKVNISEATFQLVRSHFDCTSRGKLYAKNKGEIEMYFVNKELKPIS